MGQAGRQGEGRSEGGQAGQPTASQLATRALPAGLGATAVPGRREELPVCGGALACSGLFFREFLLDEVVKGVDAVSRDGLREIAVAIGFQVSQPLDCLASS